MIISEFKLGASAIWMRQGAAMSVSRAKRMCKIRAEESKCDTNMDAKTRRREKRHKKLFMNEEHEASKQL
jgi:hypothetical protein